MEVKDINIENYDLIIKDGDFQVEFSDKNHIDLILRTYKGNWKEYPLLGVGTIYYLASSASEQLLKRDITVNLTSDNYLVNSIDIKRTQDINELQYYIDATRIK